jgi:hypothetical protein
MNGGGVIYAMNGNGKPPQMDRQKNDAQQQTPQQMKEIRVWCDGW